MNAEAFDPAACDDDQAALRFAAARTAALCTIVGIEGSFSRRLGAQIAVASDGSVAGSLADGCLEHELATQCGLARRDGISRVLRYGSGSPFIDFRLPCGSGLDILIDPAPDRVALARAVAALDLRRAAEIALPVTRSDLLHLRPFVPALRIVALGAGPEIHQLALLAAAYGVIVETAGPDDGLAIGQRPEIAADAWTAIVILFHDHQWEGALLAWALETKAYYIGALGGSEAREQRLLWLEAQSYEQAAIARVRSPIGLIPRARDARVLALSILSDVVAAFEDVRACQP